MVYRNENGCKLNNSDLRVKGAEHKYQDTTGVKPQQFQEIVSQIDLSSPSGVRYRALVQLLWSNALRRGEVIKLDIKDVDLDNCELYIMGKGRQQKDKVVLHSNGKIYRTYTKTLYIAHG